jgi:hypothetical protein
MLKRAGLGLLGLSPTFLCQLLQGIWPMWGAEPRVAPALLLRQALQADGF